MLSMISGQNSSLLKGKIFLVALFLMTMAMFTAMAPIEADAVCPPVTFEVTKVADTNDGTCDADCSLREAIAADSAAHCAGNAITFQAGVGGTIHLGSELMLDTDIGIIGPIAKQIVISGENTHRIFNVGSVGCPTVILSNLSIANGHAADGGGIYLGCGNLTISNSTFFQNQTDGYGGAIYNLDALTVVNSTFVENSADTSGGGIYTAPGASQFVMFNAIIAHSSEPACDDSAGVISQGNNLIQDNSCTPDFSGEPELAEMAGSPDPAYFPLKSTSPALDAGDNTVCANLPVSSLDQRGIPRPMPAIVGGICDIGAVEMPQPPVAGVTLSTNLPGPVKHSAVVFTASASGGTGNYEYQFLARNNTIPGSSLAVVQNYSTSNTLNGAVIGPGSFSVRVWARNVGSITNEAGAFKDIVLTQYTPLNAISLTASKVGPNTVTGLTFTASATGGEYTHNTPEFRFIVTKGGSTIYNSGYTAANVLSATDFYGLPGGGAGVYGIRVDARAQGSIANYEITKSTSYAIVADEPVASVTVTVNGTSPKPYNIVVFTATASGGVGPYEYRFVARSGNTGTTIRDWSTTNTYSPVDIANYVPYGTYTIRVWARNVGSISGGEAFADINFNIVGPATGVTFTSSDVSPRGINSVTFTAAGSGGMGSGYWYKFERCNTDGTGCVMVRDYGTSAAVSGALFGTGTYDLKVHVKNPSSPAPSEASAIIDNYQILAAASAATISADLASPNVNTVIFTAGAACPDGPCEYQFQIHNGIAWSILQPYNTDNTVTGETLAAGIYQLRVYARNRGSLLPEAPSSLLNFTIVNDPPATGATLSANFPSPHAMAEVIFTAGVTSCPTASCEYRFLTKPSGGAWDTSRVYGASNTLNAATLPSSGIYSIKVYVRNVGSIATYETTKFIDYNLLP